jgi:hypothetical protein
VAHPRETRPHGVDLALIAENFVYPSYYGKRISTGGVSRDAEKKAA